MPPAFLFRTPAPSPLRRTLLAAVLVLVAGLGLVVLAAEPVANTFTRAVSVVLVVVVVVGIPFAAWPWPRARAGALGLELVLAIALCAPAREVDTDSLRYRFLDEVRRQEGVPYVWGGEGGTGVDCSGLPRRGLVRALVRQGVADLDPALWRRAALLWGWDLAARDLGAGRGDFTVPVTAPGQTTTLNTLDPAAALPGDLAVTAGGAHVLVHLGGGEWIQASPQVGRVVRARAPSDDPWYRMDVKIVRWSWLQGNDPRPSP